MQTPAGTDDDTADETADQHRGIDLLVAQVNAVEAGLGDTTQQTSS